MKDILCSQYVRTEKNLANSLTKRLSRNLILESSKGMGLRPMWDFYGIHAAIIWGWVEYS